eukprot:5862564-Amphidinium_carterae.1
MPYKRNMIAKGSYTTFFEQWQTDVGRNLSTRIPPPFRPNPCTLPRMKNAQDQGSYSICNKLLCR